MTSTAELLDLTHRVDAVVSALADGAAGRMSQAELRDLLVLTGRLTRSIEAVAVLGADEVALRSTYDGEDRFSRAIGCRDAVDALEKTASVSSRTARSWLRASRLMCFDTTITGTSVEPVLPGLRERFLAGDLGLDALFAVDKPLLAARERASVEDFRVAEQAVADAVLDDPCAGMYLCGESAVGRPAPADNLRVHAEAWAARIDQDGAEPDPEVVAARRTLTVGRQRDGLVPIAGRLLPEVAGQLTLLLAAVTNPKNTPEGVRFAPSWEVRPARPTSAQNRHDALMTILTAAARTPNLPMLGGAAPTLVVRVTAADLIAGEGQVEIDGGFTAPLSVAHQISCGGAIMRVMMQNGRIEQLMTEERVFNRFQRRAIAARDKVCVMAGCDVPAMWCEVHHVTPWAKRKVTTVDDGVLLCWAHHHFLEISGWEIRMANGVPEIRSPAWMDPERRWRPAREPDAGDGMSDAGNDETVAAGRAMRSRRRRRSSTPPGGLRRLVCVTARGGGIMPPSRPVPCRPVPCRAVPCRAVPCRAHVPCRRVGMPHTDLGSCMPWWWLRAVATTGSTVSANPPGARTRLGQHERCGTTREAGRVAATAGR